MTWEACAACIGGYRGGKTPTERETLKRSK